MPKTITISDGCVTLELEQAQVDILDPALTGFAKSLQDARDMGVISHETFCKEADAARKIQYLVYAVQSDLEAKGT